MYVIIVYDISVSRVTKVCHYLRRYLNWIQNSVFEGELTKSELKKIEKSLSELIDESTDYVEIFIVRYKDLIKRKTLGNPKTDQSTVI